MYIYHMYTYTHARTHTRTHTHTHTHRVMFMCITKDYSAQTEDVFWETLKTKP